MSPKVLTSRLVFLAATVVCSCSDFGKDDDSAPWHTYDFYDAVTVPLPAFFGRPNYQFTDGDGAGFEYGGMILYLYRGPSLSYPLWVSTFPQYDTLTVVVDSWPATVATYLVPSGTYPYCISAFFHDLDQTNLRYWFYAQCKTPDLQRIARHILTSALFRTSKKK